MGKNWGIRTPENWRTIFGSDFSGPDFSGPTFSGRIFRHNISGPTFPDKKSVFRSKNTFSWFFFCTRVYQILVPNFTPFSLPTIICICCYLCCTTLIVLNNSLIDETRVHIFTLTCLLYEIDLILYPTYMLYALYLSTIDRLLFVMWMGCCCGWWLFMLYFTILLI